MKQAATLALVLLLGCTTAATQQPSTSAAATTTSQFKNLQVLPPDISREQLLATMRTFTRSLGVRCNHCHVVTATTPKEELDFPADTKEEKRVARVMMRMTAEINGPWIARVEAAEGHEEEATTTASATAAPEAPHVVCWTCHRGKVEPEAPPPPPAQPAAAPAQ